MEITKKEAMLILSALNYAIAATGMDYDTNTQELREKVKNYCDKK